MTSDRASLRNLRHLLTERFDLEELRSLSFDLGIDYDSLRGEGKAGKARELVAYVKRHNRVSELIELGRSLRPDIPWQNAAQAQSNSPTGIVPEGIVPPTFSSGNSGQADQAFPNVSHAPPLDSGSSHNSFTYDVFISYSRRDQDWVQKWLIPTLKKAGLRTCIDYESFDLGAHLIAEIERAVLSSRKTVIVLTPDYLNSAWTNMETILTATLDPGARRRRIIPLLLKKCDPPLHLRSLVYLDFTHRGRFEDKMKRLIRHLTLHVSRTKASEWRPSGNDADLDTDASPSSGLSSLEECTSHRHQLDEHSKPRRESESGVDIRAGRIDVSGENVLLGQGNITNINSGADASTDDVQRSTKDRVNSLTRQLALHRKNLNRLEEQLAKYGKMDAPLLLLNRIDDEEAEIQRKEKLLREMGEQNV